jgi:ring-1,2-phenylacetyl-CoA epoxidase subunit PaaD
MAAATTTGPGRSALERRVWEALGEVPDPEIPVVSVVELGIIRSVQATLERIRVEMLPTFVGCPALEVIRRSIAERLGGLAAEVQVEATFAEPWSSDRITAEGRRKLRESGFAPPAPRAADADSPQRASADGQPLFPTITTRPRARCPFCGSLDTVLENPFGPTLCRAIHWCNACRQPFEQFKTI